ncbi:ABC transporter substrate-binding protein [Streptomyces millisiae]|uniref:ABC transporter substrate-binding protein n=1 Tax=Streptomyces millisiae TaxID=3075542 RepID=A0ABU2LKD6_9ACTN|nr:ABC transporter substrate-binding protein [Streptomyces sp. DSM 44918]MDT0317712.1 ABC transporter substrate-binding protein [Streptomyces sp. DSM 44918]
MEENRTNESRRAPRRRVPALAVGVTALALLVAGCGGGGNGGGGGGATPADTLVVAGQTGDYIRNFNPYSPTLIEGPGTIFESLFYFNVASGAEPVPVLGTEYAWNEDGTELSITLREGATWSDGEAFDAEDVKFTFDMIASDAVPNTVGFHGTTEVVDPTHVVVTFEGPSYMEGPQLLGKTWIVPEHIWSGIEDPNTDTIAEPVGTGPYTLGDFKGQAFTLDANPDYWGGEPELAHVQYRALAGNQATTDALAAGQIDVYSGPVPDIANVEQDYPGYSAITVPMNQMVLDTCANADLGCTGPQTDPAVRQALYYAMDRTQLNQLAFQNTASAMSPGFALPERDAAYVSDALENETVPMEPDLARVDEILTDAGYAREGDGVYARDGEPLALTVTVVTGWTDYITALETLREQLLPAGIELTVAQVSWNEMSDARSRGDFELVIDSLYPGPAPDPFYIYSYFFGTENTAEVGERADTNYSRYSNAEVDAAVAALTQLNPEDTAARMPHYDAIQQRIEQDMPYIPILTGGTTTEFHAAKFDGWPSQEDLYAFPAVWSRPDQSQMYMNLTPTGE